MVRVFETSEQVIEPFCMIFLSIKMLYLRFLRIFSGSKRDWRPGTSYMRKNTQKLAELFFYTFIITPYSAIWACRDLRTFEEKIRAELFLARTVHIHNRVNILFGLFVTWPAYSFDRSSIQCGAWFQFLILCTHKMVYSGMLYSYMALLLNIQQTPACCILRRGYMYYAAILVFLDGTNKCVRSEPKYRSVR